VTENHHHNYISGLAYNLFSMGELIQRGYLVFFHDDAYEIRNRKPHMPIVKIHMANNKMFPLEISCIDDSAVVANVRDDSWIWHLRYGHLHFNGLKLLCQKKMVHGLPFISCVDDVCKGCVYESNINSHFRLEKLGEPSNLLSWCMHIFVVR